MRYICLGAAVLRLHYQCTFWRKVFDWFLRENVSIPLQGGYTAQCMIVLRRKSSRVYITHDSAKRSLGTLSWFFTTTIYDADVASMQSEFIICLIV